MDILKGNGSKDFYACETISSEEDDHMSGMTYEIELPTSFIDGREEVFEEGGALICVRGATIDRPSAKIQLAPHASFELVMNSIRTRSLVEHRKLRSTGSHSTLVVRVSTDIEEPSASADRLSGAVFNLGDNFAVSMDSQFRSCSSNQLAFHPASADNIVNGVYELKIGGMISGQNIFAVENILAAEMSSNLGSRFDTLSSPYDHVIYCLPSGTTLGGDSDWLAYAYLHNYRSFFNNAWCDKLSVLMHEVGHNLGLRHSSQQNDSGRDEYGDRSGMVSAWLVASRNTLASHCILLVVFL